MDECVRIAQMIAKICWKKGWLRCFGDYEDVIQEAIMAAFKCLKHYDPNKKNSNFKGYVNRCVWNHLIKQSIESRLIRVPRTSAKTELAAKTYNIKQIGLKLELESELEYEEDINIDYILNILSRNERKLICQHFGIDTNKKTLRQLGKEHNLTAEAIRRREKNIINRLREEVKVGSLQ
jgi:RNA polymerase sigma factor (sigma-70 family)